MDGYSICVLLILYNIIDFCLGDCYYDNYYYGYYYNDCSYVISAGAIIGIIIGAIVGVIIIVSLIVLCVVIGCNRTRGNRGVVIAPTHTTTTTQAVVPTVTYYANQNPSVVSSYTSTYYPAPAFQPPPPSVAINFHGNQYQQPTAPPPPYSSRSVALLWVQGQRKIGVKFSLLENKLFLSLAKV